MLEISLYIRILYITYFSRNIFAHIAFVTHGIIDSRHTVRQIRQGDLV